MKFKGLDGKTYAANLISRPSDECSNLHKRGREFLNKVFPMDEILEEVTLPGAGGLIADFVIPFRKIVVECQGEQHFKYTKRFHNNILQLGKQFQRDDKKKHWCKINDYEIIYFNYDEKENDWRDKIYGSVE